MADRTVVIAIDFDDDGAVRSVDRMEGGFKRTQRGAKGLEGFLTSQVAVGWRSASSAWRRPCPSLAKR